MIALALWVALSCAHDAGTDYDCQAQWAEDARNTTQNQPTRKDPTP